MPSSSPETAAAAAADPKPASKSSKASSPGSTTSGRPRRRGGPGGPVPVTNTSGNPLHIDMSGLRISDTTSISGHSDAPSSSAGTTSSGRRRRRRRNNNKQTALAKVENAAGGGFGGLPPIPSSSKSGKKGEKKPAKLNIGLNLDVELELKAKLGGDISLSLVVEDKVKRRDCPELPFPGEGEYVVTELFYMRVGTLRLRRRWIDPDAVLRGQVFLTALSALALLLGGFALGWAAARWSSATTAGGAAGSYLVDEYGGSGYGYITTSSWVENVAFGSGSGSGVGGGVSSGGGGGGGGEGCMCDCSNNENTKLALDSLGNSSSFSSMYY